MCRTKPLIRSILSLSVMSSNRIGSSLTTICTRRFWARAALTREFNLVMQVATVSLNGLQKFCSQNKIIVNETKTKSMGFGMAGQFAVYYNGNVIKQVEEYKYLGIIIRPIKRWNQDVFYKKYSFICDKSRKAIFGLQKKLKCVKALTPEIKLDIFDTMIRPIITYGSDVWGLCKSGLYDFDKLFLNYIRCVFCIKATTSNIIVYGECGKFPPSIYCHANVLCYFHQYLTMHHGSTVKSVFNVLCNLNDQGFQTWISRAYKQRVLMHRHQGWNVRHGLCHIYMRYLYIYMSCL